MQLARLSPIFLTLAVTLVSATAAVGSDLDKRIDQDYHGKVLTLRQFADGSRLRCGPDGKLVGKAGKTSWTTDSEIEVETLRLKGKVLELKGKRLRLVYDPVHKQFRDVLTILPGDEIAKHLREPRNAVAWTQLIKSTEVEIDLDLGSTPQKESDLTTALGRLFVSSNDEFLNLVPAFWKGFLSRKDLDSPVAEPASDGSAYTVGGDVTAPRPLTASNPSYSELAREAGYSGTVVLQLVVTPEGHVSDVSITTPIGLGLDEEAAETVGGWTFEPGRKAGVPVAVRISTEVNFSLY
ncbi:MAG: energy transducer TonB [Terriglobales bacterium]